MVVFLVNFLWFRAVLAVGCKIKYYRGHNSGFMLLFLNQHKDAKVLLTVQSHCQFIYLIISIKTLNYKYNCTTCGSETWEMTNVIYKALVLSNAAEGFSPVRPLKVWGSFHITVINEMVNSIAHEFSSPKS